MDNDYKEYNGQIILATFLAPVLGGAILYYSLRHRVPVVANRANNYSWLAFVAWLLIGFLIAPVMAIPALFWQITGGLCTLSGMVVASQLASRIGREHRSIPGQ